MELLLPIVLILICIKLLKSQWLVGFWCKLTRTHLFFQRHQDQAWEFSSLCCQISSIATFPSCVLLMWVYVSVSGWARENWVRTPLCGKPRGVYQLKNKQKFLIICQTKYRHIRGNFTRNFWRNRFTDSL